MKIGDFLKRYRDSKNLSGRELAEIIGVDKMRLQKWESGKSNPKVEDSEKIKNYFKLAELTNISEEVLRNALSHQPDDRKDASKYVNEAASKKDQYLKLVMSLKENKKAVPMYNTKAAAGTIALFQDEPQLILEFVDVPFVGIVDGAIEVVGDSMTPSFKNGARAAVRKLEDKTLLNWGEVYYIIDSNYEGYIKRVYEGVDESHIVLKSDNPDKEMYPAFKRKWENIVAIFKVKADITKH